MVKGGDRLLIQCGYSPTISPTENTFDLGVVSIATLFLQLFQSLTPSNPLAPHNFPDTPGEEAQLYAPSYN